MTEKRFYKTTSEIEDYRIYDNEKEDAYFVSCDEYTVDDLVKLLNELHEENTQLKNKLKFLNELNKPYGTIIEENIRLKRKNKEIKQLIHTMLVQIDSEKINTENERYSARIIFTFEEFKKIQQIWKGDMSDRKTIC